MTGPVFVDTNVLVYARDASEPAKQRSAEEWMRRLWQERSGRLSFQVLNEYYSVVTTKLSPGLEPEIARRDVLALCAWQPVVCSERVLSSAWSVQDRFSLSWWDALVVAAAQAAGCAELLTEDLQNGQSFDGLVVVNPFS